VGGRRPLCDTLMDCQPFHPLRLREEVDEQSRPRENFVALAPLSLLPSRLLMADPLLCTCCAASASMRCSACYAVGIVVPFCSVEHQKLVSRFPCGEGGDGGIALELLPRSSYMYVMCWGRSGARTRPSADAFSSSPSSFDTQRGSISLQSSSQGPLKVSPVYSIRIGRR
jgi:hypothetical protein